MVLLFDLCEKSLIISEIIWDTLVRKLSCRLQCHVRRSNLSLLRTHWGKFMYTCTKNKSQHEIFHSTYETWQWSSLLSCTFLKFISQLLFSAFVSSPYLFSVEYYRKQLKVCEYHCRVVIAGFVVCYFSAKFSLTLQFLTLFITNSCISLSCFPVWFLKLGYLCMPEVLFYLW